jgi:anti-sigma regulatory factor (Ser/Thr protein kinase)
VPPARRGRHEVNTVPETRTRLDATAISRGARSGRLVLGTFKDPIWEPLPAETANPVNVARTYVAGLLSEVARVDGEHVDDVVLVVSELVTNAIRHAIGHGQLSVRLVVRPRWTHVYVTDPDPTVPEPVPADGDDLSLSGRGLTIVRELGLLWFVVEEYGKTAHAVMARTGARLTDGERDALMRLSIA